MEFAFIIGVFGAWLIIALAKGADWLGGIGGHHKESDKEFLDRVFRESAERDRKRLEELKKEKS